MPRIQCGGVDLNGNGHISVKTLAVVLGMVGMIVGGVWALDTRIEAKIDRQVGPIRDDVRAIRIILERMAPPPPPDTRGWGSE